MKKVKDQTQFEAATKIYEELKAKKIRVILDDRDERYGHKMADFELIGFPYAIIVGKNITEQKVEIANRATLQKEAVDLSEVVQKISIFWRGKMKKTFVAIFMVATALFSATNKEVEEYISATLKNNKSITVKNVKVISKEAIKEKDLSGWESMIVGIEVAYRDWETDRKSTRLNSSHITRSRMPSSA